MSKKKIFIGLCLCPIVMFGQLRVQPSGDTHVSKNIYLVSNGSNFLGTTDDLPITFKVNNILAGSTGSPARQNVSFGYGALSSLTSGNCNVANGLCALVYNTTGYNNTAVGFGTLSSNEVGFHNTAIGYFARGNANNLNNTIAIGYDATVTQSHHARIGNSVTTSIGGHTTWSNISDGRTKRNIRTEVPGLAFINLLQPVMYNLDLDAIDELEKSDDPKINEFTDSLRRTRSAEAKEIDAKARADKEKIVYSGFIAQDVEKIAKSIGYDFSGVDAPQNDRNAYGLRYAEFVVPLVKAVQELSDQNDKLQEQVNKLTAKVDVLTVAPKHYSATVVIDEEYDAVTASASEQQAMLYQNMPNPFNQSTQIRYFVPDTVNKALFCIYDLQGKQLKQTVIAQRGYGIETVFASEFVAGIYLYALIADGNQVDVKRMILTE